MRIPIVDQVISLVRKPRPAPVPVRVPPREDRVRGALAHVPVAIGIATADGHWLFVNERFRTLLGYTTLEMGRLSLESLTHPEDVRTERPLMKRLASGDVASYRMEKRLMSRSGLYLSLEVLTAHVNDLSIYVLAEPQPSIVDHLPGIAVIRTDERGTINGWSSGAESIFGYARAEILGKNRRVLYRDADSWAGRSSGVMQNASVHRIDMDDWRVHKDGTHLWVRCTIAPFGNGKEKGFVETVMAATAPVLPKPEPPEPLQAELEKRIRMEESLREAFDDLRRTSEETMNELRIMTGALRDEIDRRKTAEEALRTLNAKLASPPEKVDEVGEEEEIGLFPPPQLEWLDLAATTPAAVLSELAAARSSGTLLVASGASAKEVFFEDGRVFSCASNDPRKFLAERLVAAGVITEEDRSKALEIKQASQLALGRILLILGAIDEEQLVAAMRRKLDDEIAELLTWSEGSYVFVEGDVPSLQLVPLRIDVEELLAPPALYVASTKSGKVHRPSCLSAKRISAAARVQLKTTDGFELCRLCFR